MGRAERRVSKIARRATQTNAGPSYRCAGALRRSGEENETRDPEQGVTVLAWRLLALREAVRRGLPSRTVQFFRSARVIRRLLSIAASMQNLVQECLHAPSRTNECRPSWRWLHDDSKRTRVMNSIGHLIGGKSVTGTSGRSGPVFNPATGKSSAVVALASSAEVDHAVNVAEAAQIGWGATPPLVRARVMFKLKDLLERNLDSIARQITLEHGKTVDDAKGEVIRGIEVVEFACGIPYLLRGDMTPEVGRGIDTWSARHPLGVVVGITPFNFPVMIGLWMAPMALACGNCRSHKCAPRRRRPFPWPRSRSGPRGPLPGR